MTQELKLGLCDNLEDWNGVGDGREVQEGGDIGITYGWFMLMYGRDQHNKAIVPQLKIISLKSFSSKLYIRRA